MTTRSIARTFAIVCLPQLPFALYGMLMVWMFGPIVAPILVLWIGFGIYLTIKYIRMTWGKAKIRRKNALFVWRATLYYNIIVLAGVIGTAINDGVPSHNILLVSIASFTFLWGITAIYLSNRALRIVRAEPEDIPDNIVTVPSE